MYICRCTYVRSKMYFCNASAEDFLNVMRLCIVSVITVFFFIMQLTYVRKYELYVRIWPVPVYVYVFCQAGLMVLYCHMRMCQLTA